MSKCSRSHRSIIVSSRLDCFYHIFPPRLRSNDVTRNACIHLYWQFEWCLAILILRLSLRWDVPTCVRNFDVLHKVKVNWLKLKSSKAKPIIKLPISIITIGIASQTRFVSCKKKRHFVEMAIIHAAIARLRSLINFVKSHWAGHSNAVRCSGQPFHFRSSTG